jgi:glyceraldehyde 3-phosphate dehydrogenase
MPIRIVINGWTRIARAAFRRLFDRPDLFEILAINDWAPHGGMAELLQRDSVLGKFKHHVEMGKLDTGEERFSINDTSIPVFHEWRPEGLPWRDYEIDIVLECSGVLRRRERSESPGYDTHIKIGAKRVLIAAPTLEEDLTAVLGVNDDQLSDEHKCVSASSRMTCSLAPVAKFLSDQFGFVKGMATSIDSYTEDQRLLDSPFYDPYRARAVAINIIPTQTGGAEMVGRVVPELMGRLTGYSLRVPVAAGNVIDLTVETGRPVSVEKVNAALCEASEGPLRGIVGYTEEPIVSSDVIGDPRPAIVHGPSTQVIDGKLLKMLIWSDRETSYANCLFELLKRMG